MHRPGSPQDHDHDHDHGHDPHEHDPAHPHSHSHAHGQTPPEPSPAQGVAVEDAGSIALSDALRSSFLIVRVLLVALVAYFLVSNVRSIGTQERAIVLRFGKPLVREGAIEQGPGLVWAFPYPIDEVVTIPVTELQTVRSTVGWYAVTAAQEAEGYVPDAGGSLNPAFEGYSITGDGNIIHARATIRYRITEPVKFYLNHLDGRSVMTNLVDNALMYTASQFAVDDALRRNQAGFRETVLRRLSELVVAHDLGVTLEPSDLQTLPPRQVKQEFDAVLTAELQRSKAISDAQGYSNRVVNEARGQATALINQGRTDRDTLVQEVSSEAQSFAQLLPEYRKNPAFFRSRIQTDAIRQIFTNAQQKYTLPQFKTNDQLWLHLNRLPEAPAKPAPLL